MSRIIRRLRKNKEVTEKKLNKAKSAILKLSLIMLNFIFATFAWFTYTRILESDVDVNVSAWQVDFKDNNAILGTSMQFQVGNFYPGMNDYTKEIEIVNLGDREASITYRIDTLEILGQEYQIKDTVEENDTENTLYRSETIDTTNNIKTIKLLNDSTKYPFEIIITHSLNINIANPEDTNQNKGDFKICFTWPYEITELPEELPEDLDTELTDEEKLEELNKRKNSLDTQWGEDIAEFYKNQQGAATTTQGIEITVQAIAQQII